MNKVPGVDTSSWRLSRRPRVVPEETIPDSAYHKVGLPTVPTVSTGESGLPVVDTSSWKLSKDKPVVSEKSESARVVQDVPVESVGDRSVTDKTEQRRLAGVEIDDTVMFAVGTPYRRMPSERRPSGLFEHSAPEKVVEFSSNGKSVVGADQKILAGIAENAPLPHPVHDTRPLVSPKAHGILDDGVDGGDAYVQQVLNESRWFFKDFGDTCLGVVGAVGEAPGSRAGPWRGSDDDAAATPIVRKGKVHGVVGKHASPEEKGEVDVGKSEIDYDADDDENDESVQEASRLRTVGHHLKSLGHAVGTRDSVRRAKDRLRGHIKRFAKKHGINFKKHFHGEPSEPKKKEKEKETKEKPPKAKAAKPKAAKAAKPKAPKTKAPKAAKPKRVRSPHQAAMAKLRSKRKRAEKAGKGPKLRKMKRKLREALGRVLSE